MPVCAQVTAVSEVQGAARSHPILGYDVAVGVLHPGSPRYTCSIAMDTDGDAAMGNGGAEASANNDRNKSGCAEDSTSTDNNLTCEECEDRRSVWDCKEGCGGVFCDVCFYALHRKGKRALHKPVKIERAGAVGTGGAGGKGLSGWIGPRLPQQKEVNPDMYDRSAASVWCGCVLPSGTTAVYRYDELLSLEHRVCSQRSTETQSRSRNHVPLVLF